MHQWFVFLIAVLIASRNGCTSSRSSSSSSSSNSWIIDGGYSKSTSDLFTVDPPSLPSVDGSSNSWVTDGSYGKGASGLFSIDSSGLVFKTGTTIVGICCRDGIVLGADTRSTGGPLVMDKNKLKIHTIAPFIYCCAAGTSADCDQVTRRAGHHLALLRIDRSQCVEESAFDPLQAAINIITNSLEGGGRRAPSAVMILGGVDDGGPALYIVDESKVAQRLSFAALGSGSIDAIAVLETARREWQRGTNVSTEGNYSAEDPNYTENIDIETAIEATRQAVRAGILNDLGSGSHVDLCVIQKDGVRRWREVMKSTWDDERVPTRHRTLLDGSEVTSQPEQSNHSRLTRIGRRLFTCGAVIASDFSGVEIDMV